MKVTNFIAQYEYGLNGHYDSETKETIIVVAGLRDQLIVRIPDNMTITNVQYFINDRVTALLGTIEDYKELETYLPNMDNIKSHYGIEED